MDTVDGREHLRFRITLAATYQAPEIDLLQLPWF